jgi:hypothetical protein
MPIERTLSELQAQVRALRRPTSTDDFARDRVAFARALGLDLDPWQRDVLTGDWRRLLLNVSRQAGKSTTAALLGLHEALYRPGSLTLIVSPSDRQSAELFKKIVALRNELPQTFVLTEETRRSMTVDGGGRVASLPGSEATIRGFSAATLIVEDEASRVPDQLYEAIRPMLAIKGGKLVLASTPAGRRGHYWQAWDQGGDAWKRVHITASDCPRISPEFLEEERAALGSFVFEQEYEGRFIQAEDSFFRTEDVYGALDDTVVPLFPIGRNT